MVFPRINMKREYYKDMILYCCYDIAILILLGVMLNGELRILIQLQYWMVNLQTTVQVEIGQYRWTRSTIVVTLYFNICM